MTFRIWNKSMTQKISIKIEKPSDVKDLMKILDRNEIPFVALGVREGSETDE